MRVDVKPYVSTYGEFWDDVPFIQVVEPDCLECSWLDFLLSLEALNAERKELAHVIDCGALYARSVCIVAGGKDALTTVGGTEKCLGSHKPTRNHQETVFPDLAQVSDFRQRRIRVKDETETVLNFVRAEHSATCHHLSCPFREVVARDAKRRKLVTPVQTPQHVLFLRLHMKPKVFDVVAGPSDALLLPFAPNKRILSRCPCESPECKTLVAIDKPIGLPSEPHVSNVRWCVQASVEKIIDGGTHSAHPMNRLDSWTSGVMFVYLNPHVARCNTKKQVPLTLESKNYVALCRLDKTQLASLEATQDFPGVLETYMPPSNLFDRACPLPSSRTLKEGWKFCKLEFIAKPCVVSTASTMAERLEQQSQTGVAAAWCDKLIATLHAGEPDDLMVQLEIALQTGRRHQIRSNLAMLGAPVFGDSQYACMANYDCSLEDLLDAAASHAIEQERKAEGVRERIKRFQETGSLPPAQSYEQASSSRLLDLMDRQRSISHPIGMNIQETSWGHTSAFRIAQSGVALKD
eukprot:Blabericola_migrator_1__5825@NODE_294_length_10256_cov_112_945628_g241_i0_p1_GENE_NODE_294_length_10256_cov_112_945628_g241_i0NODE_294_length_10256_cov_112_945628_g241_i0_p1_ORF_typecomplete_len521_score51_77PseudoU_synth_2/PF00849_22/1_5e12_NODE_294_length_10256_cov_112_945628_g241_i09172479